MSEQRAPSNGDNKKPKLQLQGIGVEYGKSSQVLQILERRTTITSYVYSLTWTQTTQPPE